MAVSNEVLAFLLEVGRERSEASGALCVAQRAEASSMWRIPEVERWLGPALAYDPAPVSEAA